MEKWEEGFYITGMAGSMTGSSLVVMSKGTPYTQQSYKVRGGASFLGKRLPGAHIVPSLVCPSLVRELPCPVFCSWFCQP